MVPHGCGVVVTACYKGLLQLCDVYIAADLAVQLLQTGITKAGIRLAAPGTSTGLLPPRSSVSPLSILQEVPDARHNPIPFPEITLKLVSARSIQIALEHMLQALGKAGGEDCLFAVEWFVSVGRSRRDSNAVSALWCACRILEGITGAILYTIEPNAPSAPPRKERMQRAEKVARAIAKSICLIFKSPCQV